MPTSASEWPCSALVVRDLDAAEDHVVAGAEAVHVEAVATRISMLASQMLSARAKSPGVVIFRLRSSPGRWQRSARGARHLDIVGRAARDGACAARIAS
jgi:hypothetical protein